MTKKNWIVLSIATIGALIIGVGIGGAGSASTPGPAVTEAAKPAVTVTAEPEVSVPQACLDAFDDAEAIFDVAADFATSASEAITLIPEAAAAGMNYDAAELDRITSVLDGITSDITSQNDAVASSTYAQNRDACLAAAE
jgi:hypothetical protein